MSTMTVGQHARREVVEGTVKQAYASNGNTKIGMYLENAAGHSVRDLTVGEWVFLQGQPEGYQVTIVREMFCHEPGPHTDPGAQP